MPRILMTNEEINELVKEICDKVIEYFPDVPADSWRRIDDKWMNEYFAENTRKAVREVIRNRFAEPGGS